MAKKQLQAAVRIFRIPNIKSATIARALQIDLSAFHLLRNARDSKCAILASLGTGTRGQLWNLNDACRLAVIHRFQVVLKLNGPERKFVFDRIRKVDISRALRGDADPKRVWLVFGTDEGYLNPETPKYSAETPDMRGKVKIVADLSTLICGFNRRLRSVEEEQRRKRHAYRRLPIQ